MTDNEETTYNIAYQMQNRLDYTPLHQMVNRRYLNEQRHGLYAKGGARGLDLTQGAERGLDMAFDKHKVPEMHELNMSFDRAQGIHTGHAPIGSHKGRSLMINFSKRS